MLDPQLYFQAMAQMGMVFPSIRVERLENYTCFLLRPTPLENHHHASEIFPDKPRRSCV